MAKELPYFQFEPAEYLTKDISFCSLSAQGLFINICSYYWQRNCELTKKQVLRRLNYPKELTELISEGIIDIDADYISIKFLDIQRDNAINLSNINSINGKLGGRPKKQKETEKKPTALNSLSETKGIRRDKIKEDNIKKENRVKIFTSSVKEFSDKYDNDMLTAFISYWTESGEAQKNLRFEFEKVFDISKRLITWQKRQKEDFSNKNATEQQTKLKEPF